MKEKAKNNLLIISCSKRKNKVTGKVRAWDLYDGVVFKVLKKFDREIGLPKNLDILIFSAKHGFIKPSEFIEYYDYHINMVSDRSTFLIGLKEYIETNTPENVFVCLGRDYLNALSGFEDLFPARTEFIYASGGIGLKMSQLKKWINHLMLI